MVAGVEVEKKREEQLMEEEEEFKKGTLRITREDDRGARVEGEARVFWGS